MKTETIFLLSMLVATTTVSVSAQSEQSASANGSKGLLLVCNKGDKTLSIINPETGEQLAAVDENETTGHEVIASADGKLAFVPIFGNAGVGRPGTDGRLIRVIDLEKRAIIATVDLGRGLRPHCPIIGPKDKLLYVTTELENSITVIDPSTFKILHTVPTGEIESHMLAITSDGRHGFTANVGPGSMSVLDLQEKKTLKIIPVADVIQRVSISTDDKWVFTADQTTPQLAVIDAKKFEVAKWIKLPGIGYGTAPSPDGRWLVVALVRDQKVALVDLNSGEVTKTVDVPRAPQMVVMRPDGKVAYVSCDASGKVAAIDMKEFKVEKLITAGRGADGLAWAAR
jgi:YVTN family beta-propeller protein